jgi:transglutaminase-like putative cysteine protease
VSGLVRELALETAEHVGRRQDAFPPALTTRLHDEFEVETRDEGPPSSPEATLAQGRGACRDLAVLFVECCRAMGLAARFASGYVYIDGSGERELHAWAEVYPAGAGGATIQRSDSSSPTVTSWLRRRPNRPMRPR